jgi:hypothetical protein
MAVLVVHVLETIEVDIEERAFTLVTLATGQFSRKDLVVIPPVEEAREFVGDAEVLTRSWRRADSITKAACVAKLSNESMSDFRRLRWVKRLSTAKTPTI